ncbi:SDR family oxidoreductase [Aspergillus clavatus NRRL 1]|uniref:3-oxoacyl-[acyl-carrier-protein] reductase n=1 Tax=Aspergillus clavatus (strain ATCC 1007 / CBS 513.65 / DSM 816 / NCTC 3887 / NRRL 1 / QM 1276 / 107) TaxID=344612 RepID=A1C4W5_ASPCL|nr:3-oxoacyl-[acyl-carrier-protein] reductase [Aspergillus clavatus NRRL 1]EAW14733.1 3-oxoacyl-[acyl-carrier-protein] reductase [Aspergillus clavatus NRRL 1]
MPRTWLITGYSSGFGRELALAAARNHDTVIATSRDPSKLADLKELGVIPRRLDVQADDAEIQRFIEDILSTVGPIDILVNNAGYILEGAGEECSNEEIEDQFSVNVFSQIRLLRAVLPSMRARRSGVVANLGSIGGWRGTPAAGFYCASKAAVAIYTEALHWEMAPFNIDVVCIEPGYFRTSFLTGGHRVIAQNRIPELSEVTSAARQALDAYNRQQPGDPVKGAQLIVEALTRTGRCQGRKLPARLAVGRDAIHVIGQSLAKEQDMLDTWGEIIATTDCDDVKAV